MLKRLSVVMLVGTLCLFALQCENPSRNTTAFEWAGQELKLEICLTDAQRRQGLKHHAPLKHNQGMLFVYSTPSVRSYYMKDVSFDIDLAYFNSQAEVTSVHHLKANNPVGVSSQQPVQYVLEMRHGWFEEHGLRAGSRWPQLLEQDWHAQ